MKKIAPLFLLSCLMMQSINAETIDIIASENLPAPVLAYSNSSGNEKKKEDRVYYSKSNGVLYGGFSVAYGRLVDGTDDSLISSGLLEPLITIVQNVKSTQGGVSWRLFMGALVNITSTVGMGAELGFSQYPESKGSVNPGSLIGDIAGTNLNFGGSISARGYGVDLLYNVTYYLIPELYFAFKPGMQFAYQKNMVRLGGNLGTTIPTFGVKNKFVNTSLLPQVILATGWVFRSNKWGKWDFSERPLFVEFYYQHVFGDDDAPVTTRVSSRDAFGGSLGIQF